MDHRTHITNRHITSWPCAAGLCVALLATGGCAALKRAVATVGGSQDVLGATAGRQPTARAELDELTRAFADRYVGLLSSTCDALKKDNPDLVQRREAQELMLNCATNVYDIASNPDSFTRMLDLVVVTTLVSQVWIDDDRAGDVFGERGEVLVRALHHARAEAWALAAQVLRPDQLDLMDYLLWDWRRRNPDMVRVSFVRFSNFALGRGKSATAEVVAAGGFFAPMAEAGKAVDDARLLTERLFFLAKREPTLMRWQVEALHDELVATPEVAKVLMDVHRLADQIEQLPKHVAAEREATLTAFDARKPGIDDTLKQVRNAIADVKEASTSIGQASGSLDQMFKSAMALFRSSGPSREFDIREYTQTVKELTIASQRMDELMRSSNGLLGSADWSRRVQELNQSADERMRLATMHSQAVVDAAFRRIYVAIGAFFALLLIYRITTLALTRRMRVVAGHAGANGNGHERQAEMRTTGRIAKGGMLR